MEGTEGKAIAYFVVIAVMILWVFQWIGIGLVSEENLAFLTLMAALTGLLLNAHRGDQN